MQFYKGALTAAVTAILFFLLAMPRQSNAQVDGALGSVATGQVISQISNELKSVISRAEAAGDFLVMRGGQEALYVLDGFKAANTDLLNTAFSKLGKERQAVLNQIRQTTHDLESGRVDTLDRLESLTNQVDMLVRDSTFKNHPTVYRYRGSLVIPGETQPIRLRVQGYKLTQGKPYLIFRNKRYAALVDANDLRFELPRALFRAKEQDITSEAAVLVLVKSPNWFWQSSVEVRVTLNIVTLPSQLAKVDITYKKNEPTNHERSFEQEVNFNSSSKSWDCKSFAYSPATAERRFDLNRSSVAARSGNSRGKLEAVSIRDVGISFRLCAKRRWHDRNNGFRHALVKYVETWTTYEEVAVTDTRPLLWTESSAFESLPDSGKGLLVTVTDFSGNKRTVSAAGGQVGKFARVIFDAQSEVVIVSPVIPNDVRSL